MSAIKPFSDVVFDLTQHCRDKKTGVFFITTDCNRSAYLTLKQGNIESVNYMNKRGADALERLRSVKGGTCKFSPGTENALFRPQSLPGTEEILTDLTEPMSSDEATYNEKVYSQTTPSEITHNPKLTSVPQRYDYDLIDLLVEFIGPMASVVYDEVRENTTNVKILIKKLAAEIPDDYQQSEFMERARKLIRGES
jgi:hypothetical protein